MHILHLANTPLSNAPANLVSCQNYIGHNSRLLLGRKEGRNKVYVGGDLWVDKSLEELVSIFEQSDVIHFHNFTWTQDIFNRYPELRMMANAKKAVVQFHSSRFAHEDFEETLRDPYFKNRKLVIAQYQVREYPECEWVVPNPLPLHEDRFRIIRKGKWGDMPPLCVSYAPSNGHLSGWDYKGFDQLDPVMKQLSQWGISGDLILNVPYEECLIRKSYAHVGIEEFFTGSYHLSLLEYMALECATFGHMDDRTKTALAMVVGEEAARSMPYIDVTSPPELVGYLRDFNFNAFKLKDTAQKSRAWMLEHWHPKKLMKHYDRIYESL